jgi:hypothetical protein
MNQLIAVTMVISIRRVEGVENQRIVGSSTLDAVELRRMIILIETNQFEITVDIAVVKIRYLQFNVNDSLVNIDLIRKEIVRDQTVLLSNIRLRFE